METDKRDRVLNLPNTLTAVRILLLPVFLWLLSQRNFMPALWVFAFSAITDLLDGYLARSWLEETRVGKILDPVADKLILISSFLACALLGLVPWWLAAVVVGRDVIIIAGILTLYKVADEFWVDPIRLGKVAVAFEFFVLCYVLLFINFGLAPWLGLPLYVITLGLSMISGGIYVWEAIRIARSKT